MARKHTPASSKPAGPPPDELSYEQAILELEQIIERIEQGQVGLEESLAAWRRGAELLKRCRAIIDTAEQQVQQMMAGDEAGPGGGTRRVRPTDAD
jgi:exodeoxyribonuclease VII small subunit